MSGKEILLNLEEREISIKPGSIYLCLYKLEEDRYVKSTKRIERKLRYEITKKGSFFLEREFELLLKFYKGKQNK